MATAAAFRRLALSLPDVEEKSHFGQPDFRVRNKIFADLSRDEATATVKLTTELQYALHQERPQTFYPAQGQWGRSGWTYVVLADVSSGELEQLLRDGFGLVAPAARKPTKGATATKPKRARTKRA